MEDTLFLRYKAISVYRAAADKISPIAELLRATTERKIELTSEIFRAVYENGSETTGEWITKLLESDDNVFSRSIARGERISGRLKTQVESELLTFKQLSLVRPPEIAEANAFLPKFGFGGFGASYNKLTAFYATNGFGALAHGNVFEYRDGAFNRIQNDHVRLADIKNYAEEKAEIVKNTENFLSGMPAFHTLLYGDRGTGKSTTVRATAYEYRDRLKVIEVDKAELKNMPTLLSSLRELKQKYILFVDDLCFDGENGELISALESALDGEIYNTLIYCTADRRLGDEAVAKCRNGSAQKDELALFDRFGLVVTYINPSRDGFIDILKQIVRGRGLKWHDEYAQIAELAAHKKGASPRAAKQIADIIESTYAEKRGCNG